VEYWNPAGYPHRLSLLRTERIKKASRVRWLLNVGILILRPTAKGFPVDVSPNFRATDQLRRRLPVTLGFVPALYSLLFRVKYKAFVYGEAVPESMDG